MSQTVEGVNNAEGIDVHEYAFKKSVSFTNNHKVKQLLREPNHVLGYLEYFLVLFIVVDVPLPKKWRGIVEKVNDLSAEMGVFSTLSAAKAKVFEISLGFKMLVLFSAIGGLFIVFFDIILTTQ